jgi:hypothetical protein
VAYTTKRSNAGVAWALAVLILGTILASSGTNVSRVLGAYAVVLVLVAALAGYPRERTAAGTCFSLPPSWSASG